MNTLLLNKRLPLVTAIIGVLSAQVALAEEKPHVELEGLVVELDRQGAKLKTNVVTAKEKSESTETDLRGLLADEPAIAIGGGNGTSQYFYIRGMGQNSIDLKVDNAYTDSQILYHQGRFMLDPALVKIVSVQKGAGAASAGIGATNGAIVAKTIDAKDLLQDDKTYGVRVNAGYSSNKGHNYGVSAFGKTDNFDFVVAGNRVNESDYKGGKGYVNLRGDDVATMSKLDKISYLAKAGVNFGDHRFVVSHFKEQHEGNRPVREEFDFANSPLTIAQGTPLSAAQIAAGYKIGELTGSRDRSGKPTVYVLDANGNRLPNLAGNEASNRKTSTDSTNLEWTAKDLGFIDALTANVYSLNIHREADDDSKVGYAGNVQGKTELSIETKGANINFDTKPREDVLLKYGVNYRHQEITPHKFFNGVGSVAAGAKLNNQEKIDTGVYVEAIGDIGNLTATAGIRYDHYEFKAMDGKTVKNDSLNPSIGLIWQAAPSLSFSANHNYATRSPRLHDALLSGANRGIVSIQSGTKAEKAQNTEVGFNFNNGKFFADGSYFWQTIDNALGNTAGRNAHLCTKPTDNCYAEISNQGYIKNEGYEVNAGIRHGGLILKAGVAHSEPKLYGARLSDNPEYAVQTGRTWTASAAYRFANPNLEIGVRNRTVEGIENGDSVRFGVNVGAINRESYSVSDIFANWKPYGNDKMNVNFAINNVTDENYRPHAQRPAVTTPIGAGRDFRVGVNFTY